MEVPAVVDLGVEENGSVGGGGRGGPAGLILVAYVVSLFDRL